MNKAHEPLESLNEIRSIMERSTTFMSLTGLSGIMAGLFGIVTAALVASKINSYVLDDSAIRIIAGNPSVRAYLAIVAGTALVVALVTALLFTIRKARRSGQTVWNNTSRYFAAHLFVPLGAGGLFTIALLRAGYYELVCPAMLLFFGLSLFSSARYAPFGMIWLGAIEIALGIVAAYWSSAGLILWALGFGVATLVYGILMFIRYER